MLLMRFKRLLAGLAWLSLATGIAWAERVDLNRIEPGGMIHSEWALQVLFSPDGQQVVSAGIDGRIRFWDFRSGKLLRELAPKPLAPVLSLAFSPDGRYLASGDASGRLRLWNVETGALERDTQADPKLVNAVAFSPDQKQIASGGSDGKVRVWDPKRESPLAEFNPSAGRIVALAFSSDSKLLAVSALGNDRVRLEGEIGVWKWESAERIHRMPGPSAVRALAFSPNGRWLAFSAFERTVSLHITAIEGNQAEISMRLRGESDDVGGMLLWEWEATDQVDANDMELGAGPLAFSPDGRLLACGGNHGVLVMEIWQNRAIEAGRLDAQTRIDALAFSPDGRQLVLARERERPAEFKPGGAAKLSDPNLIFVSLLAKEGQAFSDLEVREGGQSLTGGSSIEVFELVPRPAPEEVRFWEGRRLEAQGETEAARELWEKTAKEYPKFAEVRRVLGVLYARDGKTEKARNFLEGAVKADPACARCYRTLGDFYSKQGNLPDAAASYRRALELNPDFGIVEGSLAEVYNRAGLRFLDPPNKAALFEAMTLFLNAISLRPGVATYYGNLALYFYFSGEYDRAIQYCKLVLEMEPDNSRMYYNMGHAYRMKGEKEKAIEAYRKYVAMGEKGEEARVERAKGFIAELSKPD